MSSVPVLAISVPPPQHGAELALPDQDESLALPAIITEAGPHAAERFVEFFTANICNVHMRRAYARAALRFLAHCEGRGVKALKDIRPVLVAAYIEERGRES